MSLADILADSTKKPAIVADCMKLVDEEVADKGGFGGLAVKAGYGAVKGVKPGFVKSVIEKLLPDFVKALDPIWAEGVAKGDASAHLLANRSRVADALLSVTDGKVKSADSSLVRGTYEKLRGSAKKNVEEAVPRLTKVLARYA